MAKQSHRSTVLVLMRSDDLLTPLQHHFQFQVRLPQLMASTGGTDRGCCGGFRSPCCMMRQG